MECGLIFEKFDDLQQNDFIACYDIKELPKQFKTERVEIQEYDIRDK